MLIILAEFEEWKAAYEAEQSVMYTHNMLHDQLVGCTTYNYIALIIAHL